MKTEKRGKEVLYSTNEEGQALCRRYYEIREQVLVSGLPGSGTEGFELSKLPRFLRVLSGLLKDGLVLSVSQFLKRELAFEDWMDRNMRNAEPARKIA